MEEEEVEDGIEEETVVDGIMAEETGVVVVVNE